MRLLSDEMKLLHKARGEEGKWPRAIAWFIPWFDVISGDVWARKCDILVVGGDPISWGVLIDALAREKRAATIAIASPRKFQGAPLSALRSEEFRIELRREGLSLPEPDGIEVWFQAISFRAEQAGLNIIFVDDAVRAGMVERGVMAIVDRRSKDPRVSYGLKRETSAEVLEFTAAEKEGRSSQFFKDSVSLWSKACAHFEKAFEAILRGLPRGKRFGDVLIASHVFRFSVEEGHLSFIEPTPEGKIVCFDFCKTPLATISRAVESWKTDVLTASQPGRQLENIGD